MRSRISVLVFSLLLILSLAACNSHKPQSENQQPATDTTNAQSGQPATNGGQAQNAAPSSGQTMAKAPAKEMAKAPPPPPPPPPPPLVVPAGTHLVVTMGNTINTKTANSGDTFTGTLAQPVSVDGVVAIPAGASVTGTVTDAKSPGRFKGAGVLSVALNSITIRGIPTTISSSTYTQTVKGKGKRTAVMAGGGTGAGALIGGLAGGGKGALIGGLVGAGAGTAGAAFTGNKELTIPAESAVTFRLADSITVKRSTSSKDTQTQ